MVLEYGNARHPEVHILARTPLDLCWNRNLECIFRKNSHGRFIPDQPGHTPRVCPIEFEETSEQGQNPYPEGSEEVVPRCQEVVAMPEEHGQVHYGDGYMQSDEELVH